MQDLIDEAWSILINGRTVKKNCGFHDSCTHNYSETVNGGMCQCFSDILQELYEEKHEN